MYGGMLLSGNILEMDREIIKKVRDEDFYSLWKIMRSVVDLTFSKKVVKMLCCRAQNSEYRVVILTFVRSATCQADP